MADVHYFTYGWLTPVLAYGMSFIGSLLGLEFASRARSMTGRGRARWLGGAAVAIGGTGIWVMHFIAMLGFTVTEVPIRYDIPLTIASAIVAIVVTGVGLFVVGFTKPRLGPLLVAGLVTGSGVAAMHYMGMAAMHVGAKVHYDAALVALSVLIAIVAATAALWAALWVRGLPATIGAAAIMGFAVTGMHYTGMAAMRVHSGMTMVTPEGSPALDLLLPLILGVSVVTAGLLLTIGIMPSETERRSEEELRERIGQRWNGPNS
jgi:NO-binding membrane sensor protein with MHYT domain